MNRFPGCWMRAACVAVALCVAPAALAQAPAKPADLPSGKVMAATVEITATVTRINHETREITLKDDKGRETSFVVIDEVKNLDQIEKGNVVTATYQEALAYEVKKGGKATGPVTTTATLPAPAGTAPAGIVARQTTVTVTIAAIDRSVPSITFKGPAGNTRTIKVRSPEKLQGVKVGDTVDLTYTEAMAVKLERPLQK